MKKIPLFLPLLLAAALPAAAELYPAKRYVEVGADIGLELTQNLMPVGDIFQKEVIVDLTKIYEDMGDDGFVLRAGVSPAFHIMASFPRWGAGLYAGLDASFSLGIDRELFRILGKGNDVEDGHTVALNLSAEAFLSVSTPLMFRLGDFKITVTPSYFVPVVYLPAPDGAVRIITDEETGNLSATVDATLNLYTLVDGALLINSDGGLDLNLGALTTDDLLDEIYQSGGLDLSTLVEYPILPMLDVGAYVHVPVMPGRLHHKISTTVSASAELSSVMDMINDSDDSDDSEDALSVSDDPYYSTPAASDADFTVNRPFRTGLEAAWRPSGKWLTLRHSLGFAVRNPFGNDFTKASVYPEYSFGAEAAVLYVLGFQLRTEYTDRVFVNTIGMSLNMRVLELDVSFSTSSNEFVKSWLLYGVQAKIGIKMGF